MKVLHCTQARVRGGAEEHMLTLLRGLDRERFQPYLSCPAELVGQLPELPGDVEAGPPPPDAAWRVSAGRRFSHYLRQEGIDIVHAHLSSASRAVMPWTRLTPVVLLETPHVREGWRRGWKSSRWIDQAAGCGVDGYIAVSEANAAYLREERGIPERKIRVVRNGIDVARFGEREDRPDPRRGLGIAPGELLLVCAARLEPQKGHVFLLEALARLWSGSPLFARVAPVATPSRKRLGDPGVGRSECGLRFPARKRHRRFAPRWRSGLLQAAAIGAGPRAAAGPGCNDAGPHAPRDPLGAQSRSCPPFRLVCLGDGGLRARLMNEAARLGVEERVLFPGHCHDVAPWLAVADVFVLPSLYEGLPLAVMEAAAAGCAVVATAVDGTPEVVAENENGLLVPPGDAEALSRALLRLFGDPALRRRLGEQGRRRAEREFGQERQIEATASYYGELLARRQRVPAAQARQWPTAPPEGGQDG